MDRRTFIQTVTLATAGILATPILTSASPDGRRGNDPKNFSGTDIFSKLNRLAKDGNWRMLPIGELTAKIALELVGTPYNGSTLEISDQQEVCTVNLLGLDCVTFFESALGMARMIKRGQNTPSALMEQITLTRYRGGKLTDYTSRLHYTSDWFWDNQQKGVVKIITDTLPGAVKFDKPVSFMSTHADSYKQLKNNPGFVTRIAGVETSMNKRTVYWLPKDRIKDSESMLQTGDIIGITTTVPGLDCSHTGLCLRDDRGVLRFLHASLTKKQVTLDEQLSIYLAGNSKQTGIMVVRPVFGEK